VTVTAIVITRGLFQPLATSDARVEETRRLTTGSVAMTYRSRPVSKAVLI